ncbi:helix-turn-helix domain-containing protein [Nocardiopsis ansamitocini]|uniref:Transcriptional regulator n=1 Tax=Nocardiopsis ansamitocini TaxID=1670832 RepID=A0A9W6P9E0_9ACTN|nr:helix-turn-helix transcriptional regulator [Nocardiopsis ansamitocini]GLU49437.1 transcriptional regulator [Nocardiopsis ansamitocini]
MVSRKAPTPTLRSRWLGSRLRQLREESGLSIEEVADYLQRNMGTVSRFENGIYPVRRPDMQAMLTLYGVNEPRRRETLTGLSESVWRTGWWDGYADDFREFVDFVWLEEQADEQLLFDNTVLPGLLQTEDYARAVIEAAEFDGSAEYIERGVALRMERQKILDRRNLRIRSIIDEALLHRQAGGPEIMRDQLRHLLACAQRPSVQLRVLPFSAGMHASPTGSFILFKMAEPYPEVTCVETLKGALYIELPDSEAVAERYDRLWEVSLGQEESAALIAARIEERAL